MIAMISTIYFGLWGYFLVLFLSRPLGFPFGYLFGKKNVPGSYLCNLASGSQMLICEPLPTILYQNSLREFIKKYNPRMLP